MKVLFVTHYPGLLGANRSLLDLIQGLNSYQVESVVLCPSKGRLTQVLEEQHIPYKVFPYCGWSGGSLWGCFKNFIRMILSAISFLYWKKEIKRAQPDIIYSNSSVIWVGYYLSLLLNKKHIWHIREFGKADYQITFLLPQWLRMKMIRQSYAVIAISQAIQKNVLSDIPSSKVRQIYNGVVSKNFIATQPRKLAPHQKIRFCMLSGFFPDKGHPEAIQAFQLLHVEFPNTVLYIAGDGNDKNYTAYLKDLVQQLDLQDGVSFLGYVDDPNQVYESSDILLVCSKNEGMGRVTIEAMGQGLPVIGYDSGGTPELIQHRYNGLLYQGGASDLAGAMRHWILDHESYLQCSINALKTVREKFTKEQYSKKIYKILREDHKAESPH